MPTDWRLNGFYAAARLTGLFEAAQRRESCRSFGAAPDGEQWSALLAAADELALPGTRIALGICDNTLFQPLLGRMFVKFENVQRFAAIITKGDSPANVVNAGISGEMLMLSAVELGLGGCWVSGTYKRGQVGLKTGDGEKIVSLIALGRPKHMPEAPLSRKRKELAALCPNFNQLDPAFMEVAQYVRIAPSAINLQPWRIQLVNPTTLSISVGIAGQKLDLGIAICHALLALGSTPALFSLAENGQSATIERL